MNTNKKSAAGLLVAEHAKSVEKSYATAFLVIGYDRFVRECKERNFTPTYKLFTLWQLCQPH
jgi:hypothetical protein